MYTKVKTLCCTPETNITLYVNYTSIKIIKIQLVRQNTAAKNVMHSNVKKSEY